MPKKVDYAARFAFLREAAFQIVLEHGPGGLSRRSIAGALGVSETTVRRLVAPDVVLECLALEEVARRRRLGRLNRLPGDPRERAVVLLSQLLPEDETRIDEETVWLRLALVWERDPADEGERPSLRAEYQIADRGWSDEPPRIPDAAGDAPEDVAGGPHGEPPGGDYGEPRGERERPLRVARHETLAPCFRDRAEDRQHTLDRCLELLGVGDPEGLEAVRLGALLEGLTVAVCAGRATPAAALATLRRHLETLPCTPDRVAG